MREFGSDRVKLDLVLGLSEPTLITEDGLVTVESRDYVNSFICVHGGVYLVTTIEIDQTRNARGTWLHYGINQSSQREILQVYARAKRVDMFQTLGNSHGGVNTSR